MEKLIAIMGKLTRIDCIQFANIGWIYPIDYLVFMKLIIVKLQTIKNNALMNDRRYSTFIDMAKMKRNY